MLPNAVVERLHLLLERSWVVRYAIATVVVLLALVFRIFTHLTAGDTLAIYQTFILATVFAAWQIGMRPALYTVLLGCLCTLGFVYYWYGIETIVRPIYLLEFLLYVAISGLLIWIINQQKNARLRAEYRRGAVEHMVDQLSRLRREYEQTIRQVDRQSAYLEAVLRQLPVGVVIVSADGSFSSQNRRAEELLGRPATEADQRSGQVHRLIDLVTHQPIALNDYPLLRAMRGETSRDIQVEAITVDDEHRYLRVNAAPILDMRGTLIAAVSVFADITEEHRLREELEAALQQKDQERRRLQTVLDILPIGVTIAGAKGELVYLNEGAYQVWGRDMPRVDSTEGYGEYKAWRAETGELLTPESWAMARALKHGETTAHEVLKIERFDGKSATMINAAAPIRDANGVIIGGVAANIDISAVYEAQGALQESEARYRQLWNAGFDARVAHQNGRVLDVNEAFISLMGYTREEIIGSDGSFSVISPEEAEKARTAIQRLSEEPYELIMRRKDGTVFQAWLRSINIPHPEGIMRVTTIRDISQLKEAEADRTALIEQEARRRALSHFVSAFSHDFKTPMAVINTTSYLLERTLTDDAARARVHTIEEQIERMSRMVDNLITLVRLDQQPALDLKLFNLVEVLEAVTNTKREQVRKKGIQLEVSLPVDPLTIMGEQERVAQALRELLDNAIRFTRAEGVISLKAYADAGLAVVELADSGAGMPAEDLARIFQPLYRVDEARSVDTGGNGLGLSIVQQVITLHHGQIAVSSAVGQGTVFRITLPLA